MTHQETFELFWKAYPRKVSKKKSSLIWMKLKPSEETFKLIMEKLEAYKKTPQWMKDDGQFIPHPSTWLYQERWEDELKSEKSSENQSKFGHLS